MRPETRRRLLLKGEARRAARMTDIVRRLTYATAAARRYVHGPLEWMDRSPRSRLDDQLATIERQLGLLAEDIQVLILAPDTPAQTDPAIVVKIA